MRMRDGECGWPSLCDIGGGIVLLGLLETPSGLPVGLGWGGGRGVATFAWGVVPPPPLGSFVADGAVGVPIA